MGIKTGTGGNDGDTEASIRRASPNRKLSLEKRVKNIAEGKDKSFVKKIIRELPYDLIEGSFFLSASRTGKNTIILYPTDKSDKISDIQILGNSLSKTKDINIFCSFENNYFNFRTEGGYIIRIDRRNPNL